MEQKRDFTGGAVALGSAHPSFSFVEWASIKFLVAPFLRQSNLPLFAPFLYKVGTWTPAHFCVKHKKPNDGLVFASLTENKAEGMKTSFIPLLRRRAVARVQPPRHLNPTCFSEGEAIDFSCF
ncbi:hypothetical protein ACNZ61_002995 [Enterococcus hirae]